MVACSPKAPYLYGSKKEVPAPKADKSQNFNKNFSLIYKMVARYSHYRSSQNLILVFKLI